jgi:hypothetical protein
MVAPSSTMHGQTMLSLGLPLPFQQRPRLLQRQRRLPLRPRRVLDADEGETTHPTLRERSRRRSTSTSERTQVQEKDAEAVEEGGTAEQTVEAIVEMTVTDVTAAAMTAEIADDEKLLRRLPGCLCSLVKSPET